MSDASSGAVRAISEGGLAATHPEIQSLPVRVAPTNEQDTNTLRAPFVPIACWRLEDLRFEFEERGAPAQHILAAVYAAGALPIGARARVMEALRKAMRWSGPVDRGLIVYLSGLDRGRGEFDRIGPIAHGLRSAADADVNGRLSKAQS